MASTRNKNFVGNYEAEQLQNEKYKQQCQYLGTLEAYYPGNGIISCGKINASMLSNNSIDIESELRGLSSNLIITHNIVPDIKYIKTLSLFKNDNNIIYPEAIKIVTNNRPCPWQSN